MNRFERLVELRNESCKMARDPYQMSMSFWGTFAMEMDAMLPDLIEVVLAAKALTKARVTIPGVFVVDGGKFDFPELDALKSALSKLQQPPRDGGEDNVEG